jgi:hypothetical protein
MRAIELQQKRKPKPALLTESSPDQPFSFLLHHEGRAEELVSHPMPPLESSRDRLLEIGITPEAIK